MSGEILRILFDHLLLIEAVVLVSLLGIMLLLEKYLLNRSQQVDAENNLDASPAAHAVGGFESVRRLRRVH